MSFFTSTHFIDDETEAKRTARWSSSHRQNELGQLLQKVAGGVVQTKPPTANNQKSRQNIGGGGSIKNQWGGKKKNQWGGKKGGKDYVIKIQKKETQRDKPGIGGCSPRAICQFRKTAGRASVSLGEAGGQRSESKAHLISPTGSDLQGLNPRIGTNQQ